MNGSIELEGREIAFTTRLSKRAKRKQIQIKEAGKVIVVLPAFRGYRYPERYARQMMQENAHWVVTQLDAQPKHPWQGTKEEYERYKTVARDQIVARLKYYNTHYQFSYGRVSVRNQTSRWGSCSDEGNLSFNYRMIFLSKAHFDYVIVHELCHLQEMHHGEAFWELMARTIPNPRALAKELP